MICNDSPLVTLYRISEVYFRLLGTNLAHVKAKIERVDTTSSSKEFNQATFFSLGRKLEVNFSHTRTVVSPRSSN